MGIINWFNRKQYSGLLFDENEKLDTLSLNEIIAGHMRWRYGLENYHAGTITPKEALDCHNCQVGEWIYESRKRQLAHTNEWEELEKTHKQFHFVASEIVKSIDNDNITKADALMQGDFAKLSKKVKYGIVRLYNRSV